ncbi:hypothetical protein PF005_g5525 [Phytophthora fragariae]|uniref:ODAD1 central coiled coil region domain-containing protein n=1 Tax=Phytophthora fragariae TaxID=53985 RepID=A0A6A3S6L9_9STRA|nr:hypothetical protein PF003_g21662 [Phytophthora fragariae]KAE8943948.1 hypothetical protein PF009_g6346 [Phytophthora fragariae]KAE9021295.1 hypothetical protein PF011_g5002 [Phytophthora fragariae]KAE9110944.1 hypothetical protein PF007_g11663 [Phytophthora fragariae]KAE9126462.1 hypothetical protein PF010_g5262 [Phytophthora fragariae]
MPTSPAPLRSLKKSASNPAHVSAPSPAVSPTRSAKKKSSHIDQQLLVLEHDDGKRHSRELTLCLNEYAKKIDDLQEKNRRLEEELAFDDHVARDDPFFNEQTAEKLSNLYLQGNNFLIRLELERKEVARLNALIQSHEATLAQQKTKLYELAALDHNHAIMLGRVRKMEHDIDRRLVKMNEKLNRNRQLREVIDAHRTERARMDDIYTKISTETLSKHQKVTRVGEEVEKLRQEIEAIEQEIEDVRQEGEEWEMKCDRRAALLLQELKEIALHQKDPEELVDVEKYKFLGENDIMKNVSEAHEKAEHFDRIQHVNQLAEEIENHRLVSTKLREEIGKLKQRKDSVDFQRMNRVEGLRSKLQHTNELKRLKEEANREMQTFLEAIKPAVLLFHSRIGCSDVHSDGGMKQVLGDIEEQIVSVLQAYHAKVESTKKDDPVQTIAAANLSPQQSPSKRKASVATRVRRSSIGSRAVAELISGGESARVGSAASSSTLAGPKPTQGAQPAAAVVDGIKSPSTKTIKALASKQQPYRYAGLRPPHMSMEELRKKDNVEEEYPLTYHELKVKVWNSDTSQ